MYIGFRVLFEYLQGSNREIWNIPREAFGILIKSSQKINPPKYFDSSINGILGYNLMIENQAALTIFWGKFLPAIHEEDDLKWKLIRFSHEDAVANLLGNGSIHHFKKTTKSRVVSGAIGCIWKTNLRDIDIYIANCSTCLKFKKFKYTPYIEKTLVKLTATGNLFTHGSSWWNQGQFWRVYIHQAHFPINHHWHKFGSSRSLFNDEQQN